MSKPNHVPPLRPAATIILAREKNNRLEIYLLKRSDKSGFMGGLYVFPGGVVESDDSGIKTWQPHVDLGADQIETCLGGEGLTLEDTLGFSIAAIRETLEEAGVLVASSDGKSTQDFENIAAFRLKKDLPQNWFKTKIIEDSWALSLSSLGRWAHWVTPKLMKKRFDTRFFVVFMPENQTCIPDDRETKHGVWLPPEEALKQNLEAVTPLSPPTVVTLTQLLPAKTLADLKALIQKRSWDIPISPRMINSESGPVILEPWDPQFNDMAQVNTANLSDNVLAPGSDFSRIWCDKGIWKPIGI